MDEPKPNQNAPVLWGPDGQPISMAGAVVAPNALNFAAVMQLPGRLHSFRWDEAMRDNPQNALAMKRDAFYLALLQERWAPTQNLEWQCEVDNEDDPKQALVRDSMNRVWRDTPDKPNLIGSMNWGSWWGRSGQQGEWGTQETGQRGWVYHEPVHGDGIQFTWAGVPVVLVSWHTAQRYLQTDPAAVVTMSDRGAFGIKLYKPEYRDRFVIHKHVREAADYFEGEMSGGVHGVGLRSWVYWLGWMRTEVLGWMLSFMQTTGMMDLIILNFADGNAQAKAAAIANAKKISGKLVLLVPRDPKEKFDAVEQLSMNVAGVEVLRSLIEGWAERHIERLIVGQSMSAGGGGSGGLEGDGRADFSRDTKYQLTKSDALRIGETLTRDYIGVAKRLNFPWADFPVRLVPVLRDPTDEKKVQDGLSLVQAGIEIEEDELRKAAGYRKPKPGAKTVGKKPEAAPGGPPGQPPGGVSPAEPAGGRPVARPDQAPKIPAELAWGDQGQFERLLAYRAAQPPWPGAVFDETRHRWVNPEERAGGKPGAAPKPGGGKPVARPAGVPEAHRDDEAEADTLLAELDAHGVGSDPAKSARLKSRVGHALFRAKLALYDLALNAPAIINLWTSVFDHPDDLKKIGYNPGFSGVSGHATADPMKEAVGLPTHMVAGLVTKVAAKAIAWAKRKLSGQTAEQQQAEFEAWARSKYGDELVDKARGWAADGSQQSENEEFWNPSRFAAEDGPDAATVARSAVLLKKFMDSICEAMGVPAAPVTADRIAAAMAYEWTDDDERKHPRRTDGKFGGGGGPKGSGAGRATKDAAGKKGTGKASAKPAKPKPVAKGVRAAGRLTDVARRRRVIKAVRNEGELADAIGGHNFPDSEPADVVHLRDAAGKPVTDAAAIRHAMRQRERAVRYFKAGDATDEQKEWANKVLAQPAHFFEVKTLLTSAKGKVRMSRAALRRKERWVEKYGVHFHTVVVDDRRGGKNSGHRVYLAPWQLGGTTDVARCKKMTDFAAILKHVTEG